MEALKIKGYTAQTTEDGRIFGFTDNLTGEFLESVTVIVPSGTKHIPPHRQAEYKDKKKSRRLSRTPGELGYFYFTKIKTYGITPQSMARLTFLASFLARGRPNLMTTERTKMSKTDLEDVLGLGKSAAYAFLSEVWNKYLFADESGMLYMSNDFVKGSIRDYKNNGSYQKLYIEALRKLYKQTPSKRHRYLGYVFAMLPYINIEYNILCWNPYETDINKIQKINLGELAEIIGYDKTQCARLRNIYDQITFPWEGHNQKFCSFVASGRDLDSFQIFVNPHILYSGSNWKNVEVLGAFF